MTFALDDGASPEELLSAVNYLLANLTPSNYSNEQTGQIINSGGQIIGYLYKYISIKYADSFDGSTNFSNSPTNRLYYGIRNSDSATESTDPNDYVWNKVTSGFGTTRFLWYLVTGGRQIQFQIASVLPNPGWIQDGGSSIDLDFVTSVSTSPANFIVNRITNDSSAPTNVEVIAAIGRLPISGDLCTVVYNSGISSILYKYTTGWAAYIKYISTDLILAGTIKGDNIAAGTITADKLYSSYVQVGGAASDVNSGVTTINGGKITANSITVNEINNIATGQIIAGSFNFQVFLTSGVWTCPPYVYKAKITAIGGGGGGGRQYAGGGGGGGASIAVIPVVPGVTYTVTVGGYGYPTGTLTGSAGTESSFTGPGITSIIANGGNGSYGDAYGNGIGGSGGTASGGILNIQGGSGTNGYPGAAIWGAGGAAAFVGIAASTGSSPANSGGGGASTRSVGGGNGGTGLVFVEY